MSNPLILSMSELHKHIGGCLEKLEHSDEIWFTKYGRPHYALRKVTYTEIEAYEKSLEAKQREQLLDKLSDKELVEVLSKRGFNISL